MSLLQELMNQAATGSLLQPHLISRFSAAEIRESIQQLVATEQIDLAYALGDAGLALYPESEDILAVTSLLAVMVQDWPQAIDLLRDLIELQNGKATVFTYAMLIRSLRCNMAYAEAFDAARSGLSLFPDHPELIKEYDALAAEMGLSAV